VTGRGTGDAAFGVAYRGVVSGLMEPGCGVSMEDERLTEWVELAASAGPTTAAGPLRQDLVLPPAGGPWRLGLNVFGKTPPLLAAVTGTARRWAERWLGAEPARWLGAFGGVVRDLGGMLSAGVMLSDREQRLKLYASAMDLCALGGILPLPEGGAMDADPVAMGIDVTAAGPERVRSYHGADAALLAGWPAGGLEILRRSFPGAEHVRLAALGEVPSPAAKRSLNIIFALGSPLDDLAATAHALADIVPPGVRAARLHEASRAASELGFGVWPVAYQVDLFPDGRVTGEACVTVGSGGRTR